MRLISKACAGWLILLVALPVTAPICTVDLEALTSIDSAARMNATGGGSAINPAAPGAIHTGAAFPLVRRPLRYGSSVSRVAIAVITSLDALDRGASGRNVSLDTRVASSAVSRPLVLRI